MPRAKQRTPELRHRLIDVALATLARDGVPGFTTRKVAEQAATSVPAVYELFGDKAGLVREVFFEGFRRLRARFEALPEPDDPRDGLVAVMDAFRQFARDNPVLAEVMFSRPFADFDPTPEDRRAGSAVRELIVTRVRQATEAGVLAGDATDISHVLVALAQGLAAQERAGWLGSSRISANRRWRLAVDAVLDGLHPG